MSSSLGYHYETLSQKTNRKYALVKMWKNCNCCAVTVENSMVGSSNVSIFFFNNPSIPLLGTYSEKVKAGTPTGACPSVFTVALPYAKEKTPSVHQQINGVSDFCFWDKVTENNLGKIYYGSIVSGCGEAEQQRGE